MNRIHCKYPKTFDWSKFHSAVFQNASNRHVMGLLSSADADVFDLTCTVKMHGANMSVVRHPNGQVHAQSRNLVLTAGRPDPFGFYDFIQNKDAGTLHTILDSLTPAMPDDVYFGLSSVAYYGEWIGPGIHGGLNLGMNKLKAKWWVPFACHVVGTDMWLPVRETRAPAANIMSVGALVPPVTVRYRYNSPLDTIREIEALVQEYERECPAAKALGASGIGEGLVAVAGPLEWMRFKAKGKAHTEHNVNAFSGAKVFDRENAALFAKEHFTEERAGSSLYALREVVPEPNKTHVRDYISLATDDFLAEVGHLLEVTHLDERSIRKAVGALAAAYYINHLEKTA